MQALATSGNGLPTTSVERPQWTQQDWRDIALFAGQTLGMIAAGVLLFSLGPAAGLTLVVGGLVALAVVRNEIANS